MSENEEVPIQGCPKCALGNLVYMDTVLRGLDRRGSPIWGWGWRLVLVEPSSTKSMALSVEYCPKCGTKLPDLEAEYVAIR